MYLHVKLFGVFWRPHVEEKKYLLCQGKRNSKHELPYEPQQEIPESFPAMCDERNKPFQFTLG